MLQQIVPNPGIELLQLNENRGRMCQVPFTRNEKRMATFQISGAKLFNSFLSVAFGGKFSHKLEHFGPN